MPIVNALLSPATPAGPIHDAARALALACADQFGAVRPAHAGIAGGSCCAAVAVNPNPAGGFPAIPGQLFGVVFGNSRMAAGGLVNEDVGGHAERAALTAAHANALTLFTIPGTADAILFVELAPCPGCAGWLNGVPGGVPNPFNGAINGGGPTTLNVWFQWPYPAGVPAMIAFHATPIGAQIAAITAL
jgi:hypothetical protein